MRPVIIWAFVLSSHALRADGAADLARAAKSPYDFTEYLNTHTRFDWSILDKTWRRGMFDLCKGQRRPQEWCSAELIEVKNPRQVIVLGHVGIDMYFRFLPKGEGWQFPGAFRSESHRADLRHEVMMFGSKPFLIVTVEGAYGSDMGENREAWLDLTLPTFEPVFFNSVEAWSSGATDISTSYETSIASLEISPVETIRLRRKVQFFRPCNRELLHERTYKLVYVRSTGGKFVVDEKQTTLPASVRAVGNIHYQPLYPLEEFIRSHFAELKKILSGPDSDDKGCFEYVVGVCPRGPACRSLKALLPK